MSDSNNIVQLFRAHLDELQNRTREALTREAIDGLVIHSGQNKRQFLDDNQYPFYTNPHFKAWLPLVNHPNCWLVVNGVDKPKLIFYQPEDFWHVVPDLPNEYWVDSFDVVVLREAKKVEKFLPYDRSKFAYLGEYIEVAKALGFDLVNPDRVIQYLHFHRAVKTPYEQLCMREANLIAANSHLAAKQAFFDGKSEFEINLIYQQEALQNQSQLPYNNIIALNSNAAILHYMEQDTKRLRKNLSFLIDAGASYQGYAADISRTYCNNNSDFADMIRAVDALCLSLVSMLKPGISYIDVHACAVIGVANILKEFQIVNLNTEQIIETDIVSTFFPHGVGHLLGLQVHDVSGHVVDDRGTPNPPPKQYPFLRCTRQVELGHVYTIEPGIYFIPSLLSRLQGSENSKYINWNMIAQLKQYGGIRIEDNVIVHQNRNENLSRNAGLK